jgi:hypothetical protein
MPTIENMFFGVRIYFEKYKLTKSFWIRNKKHVHTHGDGIEILEISYL